MSHNERCAYLQLLHNINILDIYEQFAIPLDASLEIANELGVKHPLHMHSSIPNIQTFDFVYYSADPVTGEVSWGAVAVKPTAEVEKTRTLEKLAIQEAYATLTNMSFHVLTSDNLKGVYSDNLICLYNHRSLKLQTESIFRIWLINFLGELSDGQYTSVCKLLEQTSSSTGVNYDLGVHFFYHALWQKYLTMYTNQRLMLELTATQLGLVSCE